MEYNIDHALVVVKNGSKINFLERFRKDGQLHNIKVMELDEFKRRFYFDYTKETCFYVHKNYGVIKEIAQIYVENLYFIDNGSGEKIDFLKTLKKDLIDHNLLVFDEAFKEYLKSTEVVLYDLENMDNCYEKMFDMVSAITKVTRISDEDDTFSKKRLYRLLSKEEEIAFVASQIVELIKSGIPINNIKLANVQADYHFALHRIFKDFHIPLELKSEDTISSTIIVKKFKELYSNNMDSTLEELKQFIKSEREKNIYEKIVSTVNDYLFCTNYEEVKEFIFDDIDKIRVPNTLYKNAVRQIDFMSDRLDDEDYIILMNFNEGIIPSAKKDEDFLNDSTKLSIGLSDSVDLNKKANDEVKKKIKKSKNLIVTLSKKDLNGELYISSAYSEEMFIEEEPVISLEHSDDYNKKLLLIEKDENRKYGTKTQRLSELSRHYKEAEYMNFDNRFKGIDKDELWAYLNNKLTLSYSSMDTYHKCAFRYYLNNVLNLDKFEDTFEIVIGNIFHEVLSKSFEDSIDFDKLWNSAISHQEYDFKNMEIFYLDILKSELKFIIESINLQAENSSLDKALYEQKITIPLNEDGSVIFKGFVDKILYTEQNGKKIAAIIDYKTGNPELSLDNVVYGLDMQLPIYSYLLKNYEQFKDAEIGGFYLQKILNNIKDPDKKRDALKLQGYSNSNIEILSCIDNSYEDSKMIKSLKIGKDGFYSYAKVLTSGQIEKLNEIVKKQIDKAATNILKGNFDINPKQIDDKLIGCKFCKFKDICYMTPSNVTMLKKQNKDEFLGGD